jgi:hypothetical protein
MGISKTDGPESEKLKRFDDIFRMLVVVMTVTTSIGLTTYKIELLSSLPYFVMALAFWMLGHLAGSDERFREIEAQAKVIGWFLALLVTASTLGKFILKEPSLGSYEKLGIGLFAYLLTAPLCYWFSESISPKRRRNYLLLLTVILWAFVVGTLAI